MSGRPQDKPRTKLRTSAGNVADRRALKSEGSEGTTKTFLPSVVHYATRRPIVHANDHGRALCGAPVQGVTGNFDLECVVCAELLEGRKA